METDFKVRVGEFEGPLDILLELIEKRKLHISEVSLAKVADEFIEHIKRHEEFPMADSAEFILIASTLLLIKSKSLLPTLDLSSEEVESIENLEERLNLYKNYKEMAIKLGEIFGNFLYSPRERKSGKIVFAPTPEINLQNIKSSLLSAIEKVAKKEILPKVSVGKVISIEEMIEKLSERVSKGLRMSFGSFASKAEKVEVIVGFLAMLELVKRGAVRVAQKNHFEEIEIECENIGVPSY